MTESTRRWARSAATASHAAASVRSGPNKEYPRSRSDLEHYFLATAFTRPHRGLTWKKEQTAGVQDA